MAIAATDEAADKERLHVNSPACSEVYTGTITELAAADEEYGDTDRKR